MPHLFYCLDLQPYTWTRFSRVPGPIFSVLLACLGRNIHFYIDPPYFFTEDYYPGNIFLRSDHQRLAAILLNAEGLWLLSYNLCPEVLELYQQPGIFIEQVDRINNMAQRYEGGAIYQEVLISNYDTRKSAQAQLYLFEPAAEERKILWNGLY